MLTHLQSALKNSGISVSLELPWSSGSQPLYRKNMKHLYLDEENTEQEVLIQTLNPTSDIVQETRTVEAYLAIDAKNSPSNIDTIISTIVAAKDIDTILSVGTRRCNITTELDSDVIIYNFTYNTTATKT